MKITRLTLLAAIVTGCIPLARATVTVDMLAGELFSSGGTTALADGRLLQLLVDVSGNGFTAPTSASFTGGSSDDYVLRTFALDSSTTGSAGSFSLTLSSLAVDPSLNGKNIMLRWFDIPYLSATPGIGASYGQYTGSGWVVPSDGGTANLSFLTTSAGGSLSDSLGRANFTVAAVPEPSTYGLLGAGVLTVALMRRRRKI